MTTTGTRQRAAFKAVGEEESAALEEMQWKFVHYYVRPLYCLQGKTSTVEVCRVQRKDADSAGKGAAGDDKINNEHLLIP